MEDSNPNKADGSKLQQALHASPYKIQKGYATQSQSKKKKEPPIKINTKKVDSTGKEKNSSDAKKKSAGTDAVENKSASENSVGPGNGDRYQSFGDDRAFAPITFDELKYIHEPSSMKMTGSMYVEDSLSGHALLNGMSNKVQHQHQMLRESSTCSITGHTPQIVGVVDESGKEKPHIPVVMRGPSARRRSSVAMPNVANLEKLHAMALTDDTSDPEEDHPPPSSARRRSSVAGRRLSITGQSAGRRLTIGGASPNRRQSLTPGTQEERRSSVGGAPPSPRRMSITGGQGRRGSLFDRQAPGPAGAAGGRRTSLAGQATERRMSLAGQTNERRMSLAGQDRRLSITGDRRMSSLGAPSNDRRVSLSSGRRGSLLPTPLGFMDVKGSNGDLSRRSSISMRSAIASNASGLSHIIRESEEDEDEDEEEIVKEDVGKAEEHESETKSQVSKNLAGQAAQKVFQSPKSKPITIKQLVNIKKWQTRATGTKDPQNLREFASDEVHFQLLRQNMENVITELPLPLKIAIFQTAFPIIKDTVKAYENTLGKKHQLSIEANEHLDELANLGDLLNNM